MDIIGLFLLCSLIHKLSIRMGASGCEQEEPSNNELPWDLLKKRDPILWNNSFILFEDHLHDFGFIVCECKIVVFVECCIL